MLYHPNIGVVVLDEGIISYETVSLDEKGYPREETYLKESYQEALEREIE